MASTRSIAIALLVVLSFSLSCCSGRDWEPEQGSALATWSGAADGAGNEAGECGYFTAVKEAPWYSNVTAVSPAMFRGGAACGTCWELKEANRIPYITPSIKVVVTDVCRGGPCAANEHHFDLSGHAFSSLVGHPVKMGDGAQMAVSYTRVDCWYPQPSAYRVDGSSTTSNFAITPLYIPGYETQNLTLVSSNGSEPMTRIRGAVFQTDATSLQLPYTVRVFYVDTARFGHPEQTDLIEGLIPLGWEPGHTYVSPLYPPKPALA